MPHRPTPSLIRRRALVGAAGAAVLLSPGATRAQAPAPTPRQTAGPFYPIDWTGDADADLVRVDGATARAQGVVTHLRGRVLDARGAPIADAAVEIWQCDAFGRYRHPRDRQDGRDAGFQGRGRAITGPDGRFAFRTIRPVPYPGRAPHIHAAVARREGGGRPLVTQFYVAGEPLNEFDGLFASLRDARAREAVLLRLAPADGIEPGALVAERDVVLG